jgi:hypothetical protein
MRINAAIRAAAAFGAGIYITFSQNHGIEVGLLGLTVLSFGWAIGSIYSAAVAKDRIQMIAYIPLVVLQGLFGYLSLAGVIEATLFGALITAWGILIGGYEILQGQMIGLRTRAGRDHLTTALLTIALGALFLLAPLDEVSAVGFFGAYMVLIAVHLGLAAASPAEAAKKS